MWSAKCKIIFVSNEYIADWMGLHIFVNHWIDLYERIAMHLIGCINLKIIIISSICGIETWQKIKWILQEDLYENIKLRQREHTISIWI